MEREKIIELLKSIIAVSSGGGISVKQESDSDGITRIIIKIIVDNND